MDERVIGRDEELAEGDRFLAAVAGGPAAVVIRGEPGIGKTIVWQEIAARAAEEGQLVLSCRPGASETSLAFAGLTDLLSEVGDEVLDRLPRPQHNALAAALLRSDTADGPSEPRAVATGFLTTLRMLSEPQPVVVAVDDAQWLDAPSANVLEFTVRRLATARVGLLVALRSTTGEGLAFAAAAPQDLVVQVQLGRLSTASLFRLIGARLGLNLPRPLLLRVESASGGNPFYALQIARALEDTGLPGVQDPLPVPKDLSSYSPTGSPGCPPRPGTPCSQPLRSPAPRPSSFPRRPSIAREAGVIVVREDGRIDFTHPLFAAAAYAGASPARRRELHAELASVAPDIEERARHLMRASTVPDEGVAEALHEAARQAARRGAPEVAAELEEEAAARTPLPRAH